MAEKHRSDLLIVGSGISGLSAAIEAADRNLNVILLTKNENSLESNTLYAQGGIVGASDEDTPELLSNDIIRAGCNLNNKVAVKFISEKGPGIIKKFLIDRVGVSFEDDPSGGYQFTREAAHSVRRILHSRDKTGLAIMTSLLKVAEEHSRIKIFNSHVAIDLITNCHHSVDDQQRYKENKVIGAYALNGETGKVSTFFAGSVVIATGGIGNLFQHTSNPECATGDGIAMAYRAGAEIINSEYVQFHPTTLYHRDVENFLISESLRGEGAVLLNIDKKPFMEKYNKELKDLAPRDEVSRAIYTEMEITGSDFVYLDARGIKNLDLKERFPGIYSTCMKLDIDIRKDLIPVVPAAHYFCGGIKVNLEGKTSVKGLYAIGEAACMGIHGANRLAAISLLEGTVSGIYTAEIISGENQNPSKSLLNTIPDWIYSNDEESFDPVLIGSDLITIQTIMWNYVGIRRSGKRLQRALADLNYFRHRIERFYKMALVTKDIVELRNSVETATIITRAAITNTESLGCHYIP